MSVLGLTFQSAKDVKRKNIRCAYVFRSSFSKRRSNISIYNVRSVYMQVDVITSERKGFKNLFITFLLLGSYITHFLISIFVQIIVTVFLRSIRGISWYKFNNNSNNKFISEEKIGRADT